MMQKKTRKVAKNFADISTHTSVESISNFESGKIMTARRLIDIFCLVLFQFAFISFRLNDMKRICERDGLLFALDLIINVVVQSKKCAIETYNFTFRPRVTFDKIEKASY
jgi:hypothetical protein